MTTDKTYEDLLKYIESRGAQATPTPETGGNSLEQYIAQREQSGQQPAPTPDAGNLVQQRLAERYAQSQQRTPPARAQPPTEPAGPGVLERLAGLLPSGSPLDIAGQLPIGPTGVRPANLYGGYDVAVRPGLERAEEVGQMVGSPLLQGLISGGDPRSGTLSRYLQGGEAYLNALRGSEGGLDIRGATKAYTDAGDYDPGVVGASGILFDPLNALPFGKAGKLPGFLDEMLRAGRGGEVQNILRQLMQAGKGYPGAMADEVRDVERLFSSAKSGIQSLGRRVFAGADVPPTTPIQSTSSAVPTENLPVPEAIPEGTQLSTSSQQAPLITPQWEPQTTSVRSVPGRATKAWVPGRPAYDFDVQVVDLDDPNLLASHNADTFQPTQGYPPELQPRDRGTIEMQADMARMQARFDPGALLREHQNLTEGVPIVGEHNGQMVAESGNGRMMLLRRDENVYTAYRSNLEEAATEYGISPEALGEFSRPVLIRFRRTPLEGSQLKEFVDIANNRATTQMSSTEQSLTDADRVSDEMLKSIKITGNETFDNLFTGKRNDAFIAAFTDTLPVREQTMMSSAGELSQDGMDRLRTAIFSKMLGRGNASVIRRFFESVEPGVIRIQQAVSGSMPKIIALRNRITEGSLPDTTEIADTLGSVLRTLVGIVSREDLPVSMSVARKISHHRSQGSMFGVDPAEDLLLAVMGEATSRPKKLSETLDVYVDKLLETRDVRQFDSEGRLPEIPDKLHLLREAVHDATGVDVDAVAEASEARGAGLWGAEPETLPIEMEQPILNVPVGDGGLPEMPAMPEIPGTWPALKNTDDIAKRVEVIDTMLDDPGRSFGDAKTKELRAYMSDLANRLHGVGVDVEIADDLTDPLARREVARAAQELEEVRAADQAMFDELAEPEEGPGKTLMDNLRRSLEQGDEAAFRISGGTMGMDPRKQAQQTADRFRAKTQAKIEVQDQGVEKSLLPLEDYASLPQRIGEPTKAMAEGFPENTFGFQDMLDLTEPGVGENVVDTLVRRHNGKVNEDRKRISELWYEMQDDYQAMGVKANHFTQEDHDSIWAVLEGRADPATLRKEVAEYASKVRRFIDETEARSVAFSQWAIDEGRPRMDDKGNVIDPFEKRTATTPEGLDIIPSTKGLPAWARAAAVYKNRLPDDSPAHLLPYDPREFLERMRGIQTGGKTRQGVEYVPRFWIAPDDGFSAVSGPRVGKGRPTHTFERGEATYEELRAKGYKQFFDDPLLNAIVSRMDRDKSELRVVLLHRLKSQGLAKPSGMLTDPDAGLNRNEWRTPRVGQPFRGFDKVGEGKNLMDVRTDYYVVPNRVADYLERLDGVRDSWRPIPGKDFDVMQWMGKMSNFTKVTKFILSPFQPIDMMTRAYGMHATPQQFRPFMRKNGLGMPILKVPGVIADSISSYMHFTQERSRRMVKKSLSDDSIFEDMPELTHRMYVQEGLGGSDKSIFMEAMREEMPDFIDRALAGTRGLRDRIGAVKNYFQQGMFEVAYEGLMFHMMDNVIVPSLRAGNPDWTARQVAAEASRVTNKIMSSPEAWEKFVISDARALHYVKLPLISFNEQRSWIGVGVEALPKSVFGKKISTNTSDQVFRDYWAGLTIGLGLMALVIESAFVAAHGKGNPLERGKEALGVLGESPLQRTHGGNWIEYNSEFLSPRLPFIRGRGGREINIDLVGQADTLFRWLKPDEAFMGRISVPLRFIQNQRAGETFLR